MNVIFELDKQHIQELNELYHNEWWTKGRSIKDTENCVNGSQINIGIVDENNSLQAYARVLTDYTFKALIFDIIVAGNQRRKGLGNKLISLIKGHEKLRQVKHFELYCLPEMFSFYKKHGFSSDVGEIKLMRLTNA